MSTAYAVDLTAGTLGENPTEELPGGTVIANLLDLTITLFLNARETVSNPDPPQLSFGLSGHLDRTGWVSGRRPPGASENAFCSGPHDTLVILNAPASIASTTGPAGLVISGFGVNP